MKFLYFQIVIKTKNIVTCVKNKEMSISTKTGDKGQTSLFSGEKVWKNELRVESYGTIDELNSFLGEAKNYVNSKEIIIIIEEIQKTLFRLGAELASKGKIFANAIETKDVDKLTELVHSFEKEIKLTSFTVPGKNISSAKLDICRTIARRAERKIIALHNDENISEELLKYINRLSDLLFIMARAEEK